MTNAEYLWQWTGAFVLTMLLGMPPALAQEQCDAEGVVFGFFNGVKTTLPQARDARRFLEALHGPTTPKGEPITYDLFYNDTQGFADFVETFEQRLQEQNGLLAGRFELFFSAIKGEGGWWNALTSAIPSLTALLGSFFDAYTAAAIKGLVSGIGDPNMGEVSARHQAQINHWASLNQKMLFFAHSQGNLFVNKAYTHAAGTSGAEYVRVVHVAPASPALSGRHSLADKDLVINGLRFTGTVAPNTDEILPYADRPAGLNGSRDLIGHGLLEIYLNPALSTAGRIHGDVLTALHELDSAPRRPMPPYPDFIYREWEGGSAPVAIFARNESSHQLNKIVEKDTVAVPWVFISTHGWSRRDNWNVVQQGFRTRSTHYVGPEMNGYAECVTGEFPLEGWIDPGSTTECRYEKVPVGLRLLELHLRVPDEVKALGGVPEGTVVYLNEMTFSLRTDSEIVFSRPEIQRLVMSVDTSEASIEFYSAFQPRWSRDMEDMVVWREPYWIKYGQVLNQDLLDARSEALRKHEETEYLRYEQYALLRWEYEQKRMTCASAI